MGLLTDPKQRQKLFKIISKHNQKLSVLLYAGGLAWFLALAYQPLNAGTYFSENALLPGLVETEFYAEGDVNSYNDQLRQEMKKDEKAVPKDWTFKKFRELGLDTYIQNFTLKYPFGGLGSQPIPGQNVYAILRAKRAASTEAVVMSTPLRPLYAGEEQSGGGIAVMLALAKHFRKQTYTAKDIIFLMTEYDEVGMQAWLDGYHESESLYILPGHLPGRSGQIQAAINLEIPPERISYLNVKLEGLNGQLPNLDLVNLVVRICRKERAMVMLNHRDDYAYDPESLEGFQHSLQTMMTQMWHQATGAPTGNHGLFHRFHIEALTLQGVVEKRGRTFGHATTGRVVEGIFRSLNNLLERFHQSFFFYVLPATGRYVSIGLYMPPFGLMAAAGLIKAVALWIGADTSDEEKKEKDKSKKSMEEQDKEKEKMDEEKKEKTNEEKKETDEEIDEKKKGKEKDLQDNCEKKKLEEENEAEDNVEKLDPDDKEEEEEIQSTSGFKTIVPVISICILLGFLAYVGPEFLARFSAPFRLRTEDSIMYGLLALFCASLVYPRMIKRKSEDQDKFFVDWQLLKSVTLIILALILFSVALMNISLAFFLTATMIPIATIVTPTHSRILNLIQKFLLLIISPATLTFIATVISTYGEKHANIIELLSLSWTHLKQSILLRLLDQSFFGSWTYSLLSFVVFPTWLLLWAIPHCDLPSDLKEG